MKTTIRVLSLVLCLAMLIGVFAASAMAASQVVVLEEDFNTAPGANVGQWTADFHTNAFSWEEYVPADEEDQHIKLVHESEEDDKRILIGYRLADDALTYEYPRGQVGALDISFQAKLTGCTYLRIDSQLRAKAVNSTEDGTDALYRSCPAVDIKDGDVYVGTEKVGTIPADIDLTKWCDYTLRLSRESGYGGQFDIQLIINGKVVGSKESATSPYSSAQTRFAIHAKNAGSVEIDNIKVQELYLTGEMGDVKAGSVNTLFESGFGAQGTELNFRDAEAGEDQWTVGKWADGAHEGTHYEFVKDEGASATGGYLIVKNPGNSRYANLNIAKEIPVGETFWYQAKVKLDGGEVTLKAVYRAVDTKASSGWAVRKMYCSIRPDGIYYRTNENDYVKACSLSGVNVSNWNTYTIKIDTNTDSAVVSVNGVEKAEMKSYSGGTYQKQFKIMSNKVDGLSGTAYVDNLVVTYGAAPAITGDASIIAIAAMMLPVSGIGLGALCIKRKKEN